MKFRHLFKPQRIEPSLIECREGSVVMRIDMFENMLRVALLRDGERLLPTWSVCPGKAYCPLEGRDKLSDEGLTRVPVTASYEEPREGAEGSEGGLLRFEHCGLSFCIELMNFRMSVQSGRGLLYRDRDGLAYNFDHELGTGSVHFTRREPSQRIFGLGDKCGSVDKNGRSFELGACDPMGFKAESSDPLYKQLPFYICENSAGSYGVYYDTYSNGRVNFGEEHDNYFEPFNSIRFEEENTVFYLIFGSTEEIIRRFSWLCGEQAPVPEWAFHYCGSTMNYTDADDADAQLRGFADRCEELGLRAGGFYMSSGYTQIGEKRCVFHWNTDKIPSPEGLAAYYKEHGMHLIPNVKPAFLTDHPLYGEIASHGWFLHYRDGNPAVFPFWGGFASYLDFTNPGAYDFWKSCVRRQLASKGYRDIWNDNNEYDVWDAEVYACGFGKETRAKLIRPLFSYLMSRASREAVIEQAAEGASGRLEASSQFEPFMVSRCAIAGTPRVATTWTGDNLTDFRDLRFNHYQAMTMSLSGFYWFGQDIGGFAGPSPSPELFMRWLQYGVFMPRFVLHSWKPDSDATMPWLYPELLPAVRRIFGLRERLVPYLCGQTQRSTKDHGPIVYPVFLKQPGFDPDSDCFFCGDDILACPVFDEGAKAVTVTLPAGASGWLLRGQGPAEAPGTTITVPCAPEDEPVWFLREGAKLP